jgi:hypothetical protein
MKLVRWLGTATLTLIALAFGAVLALGLFADGPIEMVPGGPLRSGERVTDLNVDWAAVLGDGVLAELQLVNPPHSRTVGLMLREGQLYVPCDLGYMWGRFSGRRRFISQALYTFKRWHEDAERDGRAVLRIKGKLYERQAVRVTDPALDAALRAQLEDMARQWMPDTALPPAPTEGPRDIWFFRLDPRSVQSSAGAASATHSSSMR